MNTLWSTDDSPDLLQCTEPLQGLENEFVIEINEEEVVSAYDMNLNEASIQIQIQKMISIQRIEQERSFERFQKKTIIDCSTQWLRSFGNLTD